MATDADAIAPVPMAIVLVPVALASPMASEL
jgi:hypothetical protein